VYRAVYTAGIPTRVYRRAYTRVGVPTRVYRRAYTGKRYLSAQKPLVLPRREEDPLRRGLWASLGERGKTLCAEASGPP